MINELIIKIKDAFSDAHKPASGEGLIAVGDINTPEILSVLNGKSFDKVESKELACLSTDALDYLTDSAYVYWMQAYLIAVVNDDNSGSIDEYLVYELYSRRGIKKLLLFSYEQLIVIRDVMILLNVRDKALGNDCVYDKDRNCLIETIQLLLEDYDENKKFLESFDGNKSLGLKRLVKQILKKLRNVC